MEMESAAILREREWDIMISYVRHFQIVFLLLTDFFPVIL